MKDLLGTEIPDPPPMNAPLPWAVFRMNDYYWWVARTLDEARDSYYRTTGCSDIVDARECTSEEMDRLQFIDDAEDRNSARLSFRAELERRVAAGLKAPEQFACTEY